MVGVRSSRGCKTCRRKKRGCDLSRPSCGQCLRIGASCIYEDRAWIFVEQQHPAADRRPPLSRANLNPASLLLTARRQQLETTYLEAYLPSGESNPDTTFTHSVVATWIPTIRFLASKDGVVRLAFDSCILMALGQMQNNRDFAKHGMAMYCQALTKTNQALQSAATARTDATLATCELLAMCERFRPYGASEVHTQAADFQRHVQGTAQLLELRGSQNHVHEHGFALFANARSIIAHTSITGRRRAYLDHAQNACLDSGPWFQVPWSVEDRQRTIRDQLVDAMLTIAASLEKLDESVFRLCSGSALSVGSLNACMSSCATSVQQLHAWEAEVLRITVETRLEDVCANHGFGMFHLVMSYWAVLLLLSARCWPFLDQISEASPASQALAALLPSPQTCAVNIASYAHHYFPVTTGLVGPQYATFPVGTALGFDAARRGERSDSEDGESDVDALSAAIERIHELFRTDERAMSTAQFLRSKAQESA